MNMSYCMFENTRNDYIQCYNELMNNGLENLSVSERRAAQSLIEMSVEIANRFYDPENDTFTWDEFEPIP